VDNPKPAKFYSLIVEVLYLHRPAAAVGGGRDHALGHPRSQFDLLKGVVLCVMAILVGGTISRFTPVRLLARPLTLASTGITSVRQGKNSSRFQVSRTNDEIEYLGESFNRMIEELAVSHQEDPPARRVARERITSAPRIWKGDARRSRRQSG